jgi:ankyrin repeat protein
MLLTQGSSTKQRILTRTHHARITHASRTHHAITAITARYARTHAHTRTKHANASGKNCNIFDARAEINSANMSNEDGRTPLHWACAMGYLALVSLLIEAGGALVNVADVDDASPLHAAVASGSAEVVKYTPSLSSFYLIGLLYLL